MNCNIYKNIIRNTSDSRYINFFYNKEYILKKKLAIIYDEDLKIEPNYSYSNLVFWYEIKSKLLIVYDRFNIEFNINDIYNIPNELKLNISSIYLDGENKIYHL